jgi:hypothetical protein
MAVFNWSDITIDMKTGDRSFSSADLSTMPQLADPTMSFVHEYIHYLQSLGSVAGARWLSEMIDVAVLTALLLDGHIPEDEVRRKTTIQVPISLFVVDILRKHPDGAAKATRIQARFQPLRADGVRIFSIDGCCYGGNAKPFEVIQQPVDGEYYWGYITARGIFQPFNVAFLAENMARALDQRLRSACGFTAHSWDAGPRETELYNGLKSILLQNKYARNIASQYLGDIVIVLCALALATGQPDTALKDMLDRLGEARNLGGLPVTVARELRRHLGTNLHATPFNEAMEHIQRSNGPAAAMASAERIEIYEHQKSLQKVANTVLHEPSFFVDGETTWQRVLSWLEGFGLTRVVASDGPVHAVGHATSRVTLSELLGQAWRVLT